MTLTNLMHRVVRKARERTGLDRPLPVINDFLVPAERARALPGADDTDLAKIFFANQGRTAFKWLQYFPIYERYLQPYRQTDFHMLEIGVFKGGSLELWRKYFGDAATIWGIDIEPNCADYVDPPNQVRIGSQDDPAFLKRTVAEMGGIDVVLDDGSHIAEHQQASFDALFPLLNDGGLYIVEDVHTAYWPNEWNGGYRRRTSAIEAAKRVVDDMHHWYHGRKFATAARGDVAAVHFHDSILVIEKRAASRPVVTATGANP